eukprot:TRINITY_DN8572_c0_g1_i2.p1 TRINITY_DN8572_c0_g1~~TRINITY_DN8572_c0_g1_i2.p1  ORF type:complete len:582 (+),score=124.48 TRINITY_DN8572_c0_g1_i2:128-1873(+)
MPENKQPVIQIRLKCSDGTLLCAPAQQLSRSVIIEEQIRKHGEKMDSSSGGSVDVGVSGRVMREILKYCQISQETSPDDNTDNDTTNSENSFVCSSLRKGGMFVLKATAKGGSSSARAGRKESERVQQKFIQGLKMDELKQFVKAAHLLKMEDLTNRLCAEIADRITDKSVDEIRENFNIENDWAEDEDERIQQVLEAYDCKDGDDSGLNGFHHVALQGLEQMVPIWKLLDALINRGDDINARSNRDCRENKDLSPLDIAVVMGHTQLAERYIFLGSHVNARDSTGKIALHKAAQNGKIKCIELLIQYGAHIDAQDAKGQYPIHYAAQFGSLESMVELAKSGCNYRVRASNEMFNNSTPAQMYCLREGQQLKLIEGRLERAYKAGQQSRQKIIQPSQEKEKEEKDDEWDLDDIMKQFNDSPAKNKQGTTPQKQKSSKKKKAKKKKPSVAKNCAAKEEDQVVEEGDDDNTTLTESLHCLNNSVDNEFFNEEEEEEDFEREINHENFVDFSENPFHPDCEEGDDELKINRGCSKFIICCLIRIIKTKLTIIILMKPSRTATTQKFRLLRIATINCKARGSFKL